MLNLIRKLFFKAIYHEKTIRIVNYLKTYFMPGGYSIRSYSQEGEDMILRRIFENRKHGFYVDVGAHHPKRFSNTNYFYQKGWNGINIDAMPGSMRAFNRLRKRDINIEAAISDKEKTISYYIFNDPALNGFSREISNNRNKYYLVSEKKIECSTLSKVLERNLPQGRKIDFMSVDAEGHDLQVLMSNDWEKYRPSIILVESLESSLDTISEDPVYKFLRDNGYSLFAKAVNTLIFIEETSHNV